jgi:hypothetical protein
MEAKINNGKAFQIETIEKRKTKVYCPKIN